MMKITCSIAIAMAPLIGGANGFAIPAASSLSATTRGRSERTQLAVTSTGWDSFAGSQGKDDGEGKRKFRRTVYTHDDWKQHRSQDRFLKYLGDMFTQGTYLNLFREVAQVCSVATFVVAYNAVAGGYTDFSGVAQPAALDGALPMLILPLAAFTVTSPSLGLLLVFRTNTSYKRWDEARKNWGMNINHTRDLVRMANCYYDNTDVSPEQRLDDLNHVALCTWCFVRAMKRHLSPEEEDEQAFRLEMYEHLPEKQAEMMIGATHRPNRALQDLSYAIDDLPMHFIRKNEIQSAVTIFEDTLGSSERILSSPIPLFYTRHLLRFLSIWLALLPLGMYDAFQSNHIAMIPSIWIIATMLFGIEEIGTQLEEPFTVLPMQAFCDKIYNWCMEIKSWTPGDNGSEIKPVKPEYAYFAGANSADGVNVGIPFPQPLSESVAPVDPINSAMPVYEAASVEPVQPYEAASVEPVQPYEAAFVEPVQPYDQPYETAPNDNTAPSFTQEELNKRWAAASKGDRLDSNFSEGFQ